MVWIVQTTVFFALFYFIPWLGDWVGEAKETGAAAVGAVFVSCLATLSWEIIKAPNTLSRRQESRLLELQRVLSINVHDETVRNEGHLLCQIGTQAYEAAHGEDRERAFRDWEAQADAFIKANYDSAELFNFRTGSRFTPNDTARELDARFAEKLDRLYYTTLLSTPLPSKNRLLIGLVEPQPAAADSDKGAKMPLRDS